MVSLKDRITSLNSAITAAKNVGVTNLNAKGVPASETESVSSLFGKISNVQSGGRIAMFTATITPAASARIQIAAGTSNAWVIISQTRSWSTTTPNVTISSGLLFFRGKPVMITSLHCATTVLSYTSATSSSFSCRVTDYTACLTTNGSAGSNGYISSLITARPMNSSGYIASSWAQRAGAEPVNSSYRYGIINGTATTPAEREILASGYWNGNTASLFAYWTNRLPDMFHAYCPATTTKFHVLQSSPYYVTGFTIV